MIEANTTPNRKAPALPESIEGWEEPLTDLLGDLSQTQTDLLDLLGRKRDLLAAGDRDGLTRIQPEEQRLSDRLAECQRRRQGMLQAATERGVPARDLRTLAAALPDRARRALAPKLRTARGRARLLQHQSLTNWVLVQRTLLHLSQMIEIVATGGEKPPTYQRSGPSASGGVLIDRAV